MGWGAPLGFSSGKTPFEHANSSPIGTPGYEIRLRAIPGEDTPLRARVSFPTGHARFDSAEHAMNWLTTEQSDGIYAAATYYLGWLAGMEVRADGE